MAHPVLLSKTKQIAKRTEIKHKQPWGLSWWRLLPLSFNASSCPDLLHNKIREGGGVAISNAAIGERTQRSNLSTALQRKLPSEIIPGINFPFCPQSLWIAFHNALFPESFKYYSFQKIRWLALRKFIGKLRERKKKRFSLKPIVSNTKCLLKRNLARFFFGAAIHRLYLPWYTLFAHFIKHGLTASVYIIIGVRKLHWPSFTSLHPNKTWDDFGFPCFQMQEYIICTFKILSRSFETFKSTNPSNRM